MSSHFGRLHQKNRIVKLAYHVKGEHLEAEGPGHDGHDDVDEVDQGRDEAHRVLLVLAVVDREGDGQGQDGDEDRDELPIARFVRKQLEGLPEDL